MKKIRLIALWFPLLMVFPCLAEELKATGGVEAYISPSGADTEAIVNEINSAKAEIIVQTHWLAYKPIADALATAQKRGVTIDYVVDNGKYKDINLSPDLKSHSYIDSSHVISHSKAMIIDRRTLIALSLSSAKSGTKDGIDNFVILKGDMPLVHKYIRKYEKHKRRSE
jgi:hypothetical protein